ncbi:hypothetical protein [Adhaeribacter aerolatus]|nr:hypothetical protein [Adhaeribacter aerolatus]
MKYKDDVYLKPYRLSDVIRLIVALSIEKPSFRNHKALEESLRDTPKSADNWLQIASEHPEFFRLNKDNDHVILLIRFIKQPGQPIEGEYRAPLTVEETQKLVDQALVLHDKQLARYQRDSFKTPIRGAIITAIVSLIIAGSNTFFMMYNNKNADIRSEKIYTKLDTLSSQIDKSILVKEKVNYNKSVAVLPEERNNKLDTLNSRTGKLKSNK